eukprot:TRINITY_DN6256_c0_g1_i1.p1 TRINITY_DN6256_c0_g1~~TRINITY_DN6256_c0_g1_i1.p1  ORF type:complete len:365 (-),score=75.54 TRINITY_DN6256_c0_g1_i1:447-1541(-)
MSVAQRHSFLVTGTRFDVDRCYTPIKPLGQGAYGVVCSALDHASNEKVAIKKVGRLFDKNINDCKRILREIRLLREFRHENLMSIRTLLRPPSYEAFEDLYIVSELMDVDLQHIIKSPQPLSDEHIQYFVYQILRGLKYMHSASVIHRDLKPSNILVNGNCDLKICDFGNSRVADPENAEGEELTEYITTRWFRAPECLIGCKEYTNEIDIWSVGCIFAELLARRPLFPGKEYIHQLHLIMDVVGTPKDDDLEHIATERAKKYIRSCPQRPKVPLSIIFPSANPQAIDLMEKMLVFNPNQRITVEQALEHPYLAHLHNVDEEPTSPVRFHFEFENMELTKEDIKTLIWREIMLFNPDLSPPPQQ